MKILHTADWHLGAYVGPQCDDPYKRMENTIKCLDKLVETVRQEQPDIILVAGDIFHQAKVWADRAMVETRTALNYLGILGSYAPTCVLFGTPNHDNIEIFKTIEESFGSDCEEVQFFSAPEIRVINTSSGPIQIAGLPGFDKGYFRAQYPGLSAEEENQIFTQQLSAIVQGLSAQLDPNIPSLLMAHHTVAGCEMDNGQHIFQANEVVLGASALDNSNFDIVCLGHIHKAQRVDICNKPVYYSGSIDAFTFNDEGHEKGFWLHNLGESTNTYNSSKFVWTPAREFYTTEWAQDGIESYIQNGLYEYVDEYLRDKVVRVLYTCDEAIEKALDKKKLEKDLYAAGAYYVTEIRPEKIEASVNRERLHEKLTVEDCLCKYLTEKYPGDTGKVVSTMLGAKPIIDKIQASAPAGGQTGLFLPVEISVHNYRSYADETLNFQDIYFAMISGRNGAGKSSLFMDAIVDCLYEQPREGDLTGWIRSGERSGSISFTFRLSDETYRVTRTRQRSGKATLALACAFVDDDGEAAWTDLSCQKLVDTQEKILQLLGMDADTFRSCVLIMQDQYGRFMEAKPENRMAVLASLLGLGIYEQLEKETKDRLTDINREIRNLKDEEQKLQEEVGQLDGLQVELTEAKQQLQSTQITLDGLKKQKDDLLLKVASLNQVKQELDKLLLEIQKRNTLAQEKQKKLDELINNIIQTKGFLKAEEHLKSKHMELQESYEKLAALDGKVARLQDKQVQRGKLNMELSSLEAEKGKLEVDMEKIQLNLQTHDALVKDIVTIEGAEAELQEWEKKSNRYNSLSKQIFEASSNLKSFDQETGFIIDNLKSAREAYKQRTKLLEESGCVDIDNANCEFLKDAKKAIGEISRLDVEIESLINAKKIERNILSENLEKIQNELSELGYTTETHIAAKAKLNKLNQLKQQLASLEGDKKLLKIHSLRYGEVVSRIASAGNEKGQLDTEVYSLQQDVSGYEELKKLIKDLEKLDEQWQQIPVAKNYIKTIVPQTEDLTREINELNELNKCDIDKSAELRIQVEAAGKYQDELDSVERSISDYEVSVRHFDRLIGSLEEKMAGLEQKNILLKEKLNTIAQYASKAARLQVLSEAFSQDGIPHQIIRDIIPELEAAANEILGQMTGGWMRLEFRTERTLKSNKAKEIATLDIVVIDVDYGELPYLSRSGGQKVRAALAASFALAIVKASRVGLQLGMMFVDEPPFLDAEGVEAYCMALEVIHNKYPEMRIVAISHDENMKARFPQQLTVVPTETGSKVVRG